MLPAPHAAPNSVLEVIQKGYHLHDRLLRAAKVIVARGEDG
jgi:molecular chaperone GrpE (heat shock protein)